MKIRRHSLVLVGLGALVGLCAAGCQNGQLQPGGLFSAVNRRGDRERVELVAARTEGETIAPAPAMPAATITSPIIRASAQEEMPAGAVIASSWRALPRGAEPDPLSIEVSQPVGPVARATTEPEKLGAPRTVNSHAQSEVVMHQGHPSAVVHVGAHHGGPVVRDDVPREGLKAPLPPYVIEPPDLLLIQLLWRDDPKILPQPIDGQFLVRPDGTVNLGIYGTVQVAGKTIDEARQEVERLLDKRLKLLTDKEGKPLAEEKRKGDVAVDVLEFASKFCYLIASGGGHGETVVRIPINGSDTVLDIVGKVGGLPPQASLKKIWLARANLGHPGHQYLLPIDWAGIAQRAQVDTNYQVTPGDRIYVQSDVRIRLNTEIVKTTEPIQHLLGTTLLGSTTVNSIKGRSSTNR